ncbi:hypothetical protein V1508DRAFT_457031, partial [Lipomyces doorenjongii]|uniref:uncharacterized protein n=1 Tax=Lipomyces doorenjongii TaxID=383834 RepID=UPI0034CFEC22
MSSEIAVFQCTLCNHAPFYTKEKLRKHSSSRHRKAATFSFNGETFPLLVTDDSKYICPTCKTETSSVRSLKRHMGRQNCRTRQVIEGPTIDQPEDTQSENGDATGTIEGPHKMADLGLTYENTWNVAVCDRCHFVVDKAMVIEHLTTVHGLVAQNYDSVLRVLRMHRLRPHLAIIWDDAIEDQLDESDDEDQGAQLFNPPAFRPGSASLQGIPVQDGFKCR